MSSLAEAVSKVLGRALTTEDVKNLNSFQRIYGIDDEDPLIVVLAMMGANRIMLESFPLLMQQKALETIELHKQTLGEQSTIIAKDLISVIAHDIMRKQWILYMIVFFGGAIVSALILHFFGH